MASCLVLTIVEIILLARHKLRPRAFLIMNSVKTVIWTGMWLYDVIGTATQKYVAVNTTVLVILISAVLWYDSLPPLKFLLTESQCLFLGPFYLWYRHIPASP